MWLKVLFASTLSVLILLGNAIAQEPPVVVERFLSAADQMVNLANIGKSAHQGCIVEIRVYRSLDRPDCQKWHRVFEESRETVRALESDRVEAMDFLGPILDRHEGKPISSLPQDEVNMLSRSGAGFLAVEDVNEYLELVVLEIEMTFGKISE